MKMQGSQMSILKKTESELIGYFFSSEKKYKMKQLAKNIIQDFDMPQLENLVVYNMDDNLIVLEGNRRVSIYKLLANPKVIDNIDIQMYFMELNKNVDINENYKLDCIVTTDYNKGIRYIERKHLNNNNEVSWGDAERSSHKVRMKKGNKSDIFRKAVSDIVKKLDISNRMKSDVMGKGYVTTFFRILDSKPAWIKYKFKIENNKKLTFDYPNFTDELKVIITNILDKKDFKGHPVDSRTMNKNLSKEKFLNGINSEDINLISTLNRKASSEEHVDSIHSTKSIKYNKTKKVKLHDRLFDPEYVPCTINSPALELLYEELRDIPINTFPNATHDLLRSFLECSLLVYFKKTGEFSEIPKDNKIGKNPNPKLSDLLKHIINRKCKYITDENLIACISHVNADWYQPYSIERLNMRNHNENWASTTKDVRATWAKLEGLFKIILN
jgi:hypothetical protein